ncbi:MAG: anthranilate phosphoribosyltransferase [Candidatus Neomarinimicrobiota bacterium]
MNNLLEKLVNKIDLTEKEAYNMMISIMSGDYDDIQISGMLTALRCKGETVKEITGFARAMRKKMVSVKLNVPAIDMCGTGGDSKGTFNISTAATFVVAGSGVNVAKHGNRSMTSKSGSADVLQALGISINRDINDSIRDVQEVGLGFFFAPDYHPAMKHAIKPRTSLGIRTVFNILGPLCNPANVKAQAMGIFSPKLTEIQLKVLKELGSKEAMVFHGLDGLDEITTTTKTKISQLTKGNNIKTFEFDPLSLGIDVAKINDLKGGDPTQNATIIKSIMNGNNGPKRDIVLLNAAAGILVGGMTSNIEEGYEIAKKVVDSGKAKNVMNKLIK